MKRPHPCRPGALSPLPLAVFALSATLSAFANGLSTRSVTNFLDSATPPGPRIAENGTVPIALAGEWFPSGACELVIDGASAASSSGAFATYLLAANPTTWTNHVLTLRSSEGETTRYLTIYPYAGFRCAFHRIRLAGNVIDARPAGTVRRLDPDSVLPVTWSAIWNEGASAPVVTLRDGDGAAAPALATLLSNPTGPEGDFDFSPKPLRLGAGRYTLTHFDGVETLFAPILVRRRGTFYILR